MTDVIDTSEKIHRIEDYFEMLPRLISKSKENIYYRGQNDFEYNLSPSVFRTPSIKKNESKAYIEVMTECSNEFIDCKLHNEILSKMQHYGLPTRLLDITTNALVALYFACDGNSEKDGAVFVIKPDKSLIKNYESDAISILASIPRFSEKEKNELLFLAENCNDLISQCKSESKEKYINNLIEKFNKENIVRRLLHEIKKEKPAFEDIIHPGDLVKNFFLIPQKNNPRIIRQSGAFIIFGLKEAQILESLELNENNNTNTNTNVESDIKTYKIIIDAQSKMDILSQLNVCGITKASLHPELYKVAEFVKSKYE